jgi:hypothetical protein
MVKAPVPEILPPQSIIPQAKTSPVPSTSSKTSSTANSRRSFESMYLQYHPRFHQYQQQTYRHQFHTPFYDKAPPVPCIIIMVWQGEGVIQFTNHLVKSRTPATILSDLVEDDPGESAEEVAEKFLYCSEDEERARKDIEFWFGSMESLELPL